MRRMRTWGRDDNSGGGAGMATAPHNVLHIAVQVWRRGLQDGIDEEREILVGTLAVGEEAGRQGETASA